MSGTRSEGRGEPVGPDTILLDGVELPRVLSARRSDRKRYLCLACGTWVCRACGGKRQYANRKYSGIWTCAKKGCSSHPGTGGDWEPVYHHQPRWWEHNDADIQAGSQANRNRP